MLCRAQTGLFHFDSYLDSFKTKFKKKVFFVMLLIHLLCFAACCSVLKTLAAFSTVDLEALLLW